MAERVLNNEVDILNVGNVDNDIKDSFTRAMISETVNDQNTATKDYKKGEYFIHNDRFLYKAKEDISVGDIITPSTNAQKTTLVEMLEEIETEGTGGGHTIQNEFGANVTQRSTMQFTGDVEVTDDSENGKTVVNITKATEITWDEWRLLTDEQKETGKWDITGVPNVDGTINAELLTKLWENPDPSSEFGEQDMKFSSDDYDFTLTLYMPNINAELYVSGDYITVGTITKKGNSIHTEYSSGNTYSAFRELFYMGDTTYHAGRATWSTAAQNSTVDNSRCVPLAVYGFKSTLSLKVNMTALEVSTSASKCMLEDGRSVEEVIQQQPNFMVMSISEHDALTEELPAGTVVLCYED